MCLQWAPFAQAARLYHTHSNGPGRECYGLGVLRTTNPRIVSIAALIAALLVAVGPALRTGAQPERLVLALYYPWYGLDTWVDPALSDTPAQPYFGTDPDAIGRQVGWAKDAGID